MLCHASHPLLCSAPFAHRFYNLRNDTNISSEYQLSAENELDFNTESDQSSEQQLDHQDESEDTEKTQPVTPDQNTNTLQRTEPKNETKILKPENKPQFDFGEQYFVDEFPSQTVSLVVFRCSFIMALHKLLLVKNMLWQKWHCLCNE